MQNRTALVAAVLVAFNLFACSEADTSDASQQESPVVASDSRFVEAAQPAPFAGTVVSKDDLAKVGATEPSPSYAGLAAPSADQKNGVAQPTVAKNLETDFALPLGECQSSKYLCTGHGTLVLHSEGENCMLGEVTLSSDWTAQYREDTGSWSGNAELFDVTFHGVTTHCERN